MRTYACLERDGKDQRAGLAHMFIVVIFKVVSVAWWSRVTACCAARSCSAGNFGGHKTDPASFRVHVSSFWSCRRLRKSKKLIDAYVQTCEYAEKRDKTPDRQAVAVVACPSACVCFLLVQGAAAGGAPQTFFPFHEVGCSTVQILTLLSDPN